MRYGIAYLVIELNLPTLPHHPPPRSDLLFPTCTETSRNCITQTFIHYTSTGILWKQIYLFRPLESVHALTSLRSSTPLTDKVTLCQHVTSTWTWLTRVKCMQKAVNIILTVMSPTLVYSCCPPESCNATSLTPFLTLSLIYEQLWKEMHFGVIYFKTRGSRLMLKFKLALYRNH